MIKQKKLYRFFLYQFLCALVIVLICTLISGFMSYRVLYTDLESWTTETNDKLREQYANYIDRTLAEGANEVYIQILSEINSNQTFDFYTRDMDITDIKYTLDVQSYLFNIKNASPIIDGISIYYPKSNLLISDDRIRYTLFYEYRQEDIQPYSELLNNVNNLEGKRFYAYWDDDTIDMVRTVSIGDQVKAGVFIEYSIPALQVMLSTVIPYEDGNVLLTDSEGNVLFDMLGDYMGNNLQNDTALGRSLDKDDQYTAEVSSIHSVVSCQTAENGWKYIVIVPIDTMINPAYYILKSLLISATVTLSLGLFLAIILSFWQSRPLKPIIELCNQTGAGGVDAYGAIQGTLTKLLSMVEDRDLKLERILPQLRDDFILWLLTKLPADKGEIDDRMLFLQVSFPYRNFCVIVVKTTADEMQVEHSMAYAKLTLQQVFNTEHSMCGFFRKDGLLLGLVNYDYPYDDTVALSRTVLDQNAEGDCQYYYSVAHLHDDLSALATMITQMIESLKYSFLYPEKHFYVPEFAAVMNQKNDEDDKNQLMSFYNALRNYDKDNAETRLRDIFENLRKDGCNLDRLYAIIMKLTSEIESFFGSRPHLQRELAQLVDETPDILHFTHSLCEIIDEEIQTKREQYPLSSVELVEGAVAYIGNHLLDNQLSLPIVASELSVNPNYLSNIFHKVKGMTFVEYITGEKINYGRELLLETDLNLREISVKLNYASPQYFISRFKKQFRITPSVYRERHRTNGDDCTGAKSFTQ